MLLLRNPVQRYPWGAVDGLAAILGSTPSGGPEAELWVGTHPSAPSMVADDPSGRTLAQVLAADPARWLGPDLAGQGHTALPFLLKVLAIGAPLSLQAHPSAEQAAAGFDREEAAGIALDGPDRLYRDRSPKPESLVALSDTWALCGFRERGDAADLVADLQVLELEPLVATLRGGGAASHRDALSWLLHLSPSLAESVGRSVAQAVAHVDSHDQRDPRSWVRELVASYPSDPTCLAPLLLHVVYLAEGDALHLPAGNLHAYLTGSGVELMAASDNVLRCGLTAKHVDVDELLGVLQFSPGVPPGPTHTDLGGGLATYDSGEDAYGLAVVDAGPEPVVIQPEGPSLLLATGGDVDVAGVDRGVSIDHGDAVFVPPGAGPLSITGAGRLWWATVGNALPIR